MGLTIVFVTTVGVSFAVLLRKVGLMGSRPDRDTWGCWQQGMEGVISSGLGLCEIKSWAGGFPAPVMHGTSPADGLGVRGPLDLAGRKSLAPAGISLSCRADLSDAQTPEVWIEATAGQYIFASYPLRVYETSGQFWEACGC